LSIIIGAVYSDAAVLCVDTYMTLGDGKPVNANKIHLLAFQHAALAARGLSGVVSELMARIDMSGHTFDELVREMPEMLDSIYDSGATEIAHTEAQSPAGAAGTEIVIVGWSGGAPVMHRWEKFLGCPAMHEASRAGSALYSPGIGLGDLPGGSNFFATAITISRRQAESVSSHWGRKAAGGQLIVMEVRRDLIASFKPRDIDTTAPAPAPINLAAAAMPITHNEMPSQ
jgi:hypothetical protein